MHTLLGEMAPIKAVRTLPPSESCSSRVSALSRNGTWSAGPPRRCCSWLLMSVDTTRPSAVRLALIADASRRLAPRAPLPPSAPVAVRSLPARSTSRRRLTTTRRAVAPPSLPPP